MLGLALGVAMWSATFMAGCERQAHSASSADTQAAAAADGQPQRTTMRLGTYDSRAVAVAFVRSPRHAAELKALHQQHAEAKKAGDQKRVKELEARGEALQIRAHLQAFSNAPVDDILSHVRDQLPGIAQRHNVAAIVATADYQDLAVEVVDVTDFIVGLFEPNEQTLQVVAGVRKQKPQPIEEVAKIPARN